MAFTDILENGFAIWKNNLKIAVPFVLNALAQLLLTFAVGIVLVVVSFFLGMGLMAGGLPDVTSFFSGLSLVMALLLVLGFILGTVVFVAVQVLIQSFFESGAIGTAKDAVNTGNTEFSTFIDVGMDKGVSLFVANMIRFLLFVVPLLIVAFVAGIFFLAGLSFSNPVALVIVLPVVFVLFAYYLILDIVFKPVPYAVVLSDHGAIEGVKKGVGFALNHKLYVFLLWILLMLINLIFFGLQLMIRTGAGFIHEIFGALVGFGAQIFFGLITVLIISPLFTVFWTYLYMKKEDMQMKDTGLDDVDETLESLRTNLGMNEDIPTPEPKPLREE